MLRIPYGVQRLKRTENFDKKKLKTMIVAWRENKFEILYRKGTSIPKK